MNGRCYGCFRPRAACFCASIPTIDNRTSVLILQHVRERFHPFNTARIVSRALGNSNLLVDHNARLAAAVPRFGPRAGLLYPRRDAALLGDLPAHQQPEQLVLIDGTWNQARSMLREIPALRAMPCYALAPAEPGRYQIRREPTASSLSTLEAVVAALAIIEPETRGLDALLAVFDTMVERQLAHPKADFGWRRNRRRRRTRRNVPSALVDDLGNVVVAYGEAGPPAADRQPGPRRPVYWSAQRLGTGERFSAAIETEGPLSDLFLERLELAREDLAEALPPARFLAAWSAFLRPTDTLAVYNQSTARLLAELGAAAAGCLVLKSIDVGGQPLPKDLEERVAAQGLSRGPVTLPGRAGRRLAATAAWARFVSRIGDELSSPG